MWTLVHTTDVDFGSRMRRSREARGVSLRQIADATKLPMAALEALERDDIARLPGGIFSRAFVRAYASEIGIDPEGTVREFIARFPTDSGSMGGANPSGASESSSGDRRRPGATVVAMCTVALLLASAVIYLFFPAR